MESNVGIDLDLLLFTFWLVSAIVSVILFHRRPDKGVFDNGLVSLIFSHLFGGELAILLGPIALIVILMMPEKQVCNSCYRTFAKKEFVCPHCLGAGESFSEYLPANKIRLLLSEQQIKRFFRYQRIDTLILFVSTIGFSFLLYSGLSLIGDWWIFDIHRATYYWQIFDPGMLWFSAIGISLGLAIGVVYLVNPLIMKDASQFTKLFMTNFGRNGERVFILIFVAISVFSVILAGLMINSYLVVYPDEIAHNEFIALIPEHYEFTEIQSIRASTHVDSINFTYRIFVIDFFDGRQWSSYGHSSIPKIPFVEEIMMYVSNQSGVEITSVPGFQTERDFFSNVIRFY